jgi:hypothetical protein
MRLIWYRNCAHRSTFERAEKISESDGQRLFLLHPPEYKLPHLRKWRQKQISVPKTLCSVRNVTHKITEVTNHTTFNIPQIFFTIYVLQQTYWASLMDPRTTPPALIAIRVLGETIS